MVAFRGAILSWEAVYLGFFFVFWGSVDFVEVLDLDEGVLGRWDFCCLVALGGSLAVGLDLEEDFLLVLEEEGRGVLWAGLRGAILVFGAELQKGIWILNCAQACASVVVKGGEDVQI